jgi:hypothetical protein
MSKVYAPNADFVQRDVAGECLLIPIRRQLADVNSLYVLNETGAAAWRLLDGKRSLREIAGDLSREFDVTVEQVEQDLMVLVEDLLSIQAIRETPG